MLGTNAALINSSLAVASLAGGVISTLSVTAGGADFSYPTTAAITGGGGSGAAAVASLGLTTASIALTNGGINYTSAPTVSITGGGGTGAKATATVSGGVVTAITVTDPGNGYTNAPTIVLSAGGGTDAGASADAVHFTVVGTTLTSGGSGYTSAPSVSFDGGDGGGAAATANLASVVLVSASAIGGNGPMTINSVISGASSLTKSGIGTLTLTAANTYSGGTTVSGGTLLVNNTSGSGTGPGAVTLNGGTLGGTGKVSGAVTGTTGGSIAAGSSAGILTLGNGLNLSGGGTNVWELAALKDDADGVGGTDFDQVALTGGVLDLSGNSQLLVKFTGSASVPFSTTPFWQANHSWTILTLAGTAANTPNLAFSAIPNGIFNAGSFSNYVGTGGKIILTYTTNATSKPVITAQPQSVTTNWLRPITLSVTAIGTDPESYSWYHSDFSNLVGTNSTYTNLSVLGSDQGSYFVVITNLYGSATSDAVTLTVLVPPQPTLQTPSGVGTTNVVLSWSSVTGATYALQYNTNLADTNWYLVTNLLGSGGALLATNHPPVGEPQRYFRVLAQ